MLLIKKVSYKKSNFSQIPQLLIRSPSRVSFSSNLYQLSPVHHYISYKVCQKSTYPSATKSQIFGQKK